MRDKYKINEGYPNKLPSNKIEGMTAHVSLDTRGSSECDDLFSMIIYYILLGSCWKRLAGPKIQSHLLNLGFADVPMFRKD